MGTYLKYSFNEIFSNSSSRIILVVFLFLTLLSSVFVLHSYSTHIANSQASELEKLQICTGLLAEQIDAEAHYQLTERHASMDELQIRSQDSVYLAISHMLQLARESFGLETDIYTLILEQGKFQFVVSSGETPYYRHPWNAPNESHFKFLETGAEIGPYEDENGVWLSSFEPLRFQGRIIGFVQADQRFNAFLDKAKADFVSSILVFVVIFLICCALLLKIINNILSKEERVKSTLFQQSQRIRTTNQDLMSSLKVAKRLQEAVLPNVAHLENYFPSVTVIYEPKDIVSGDFYWFERVGSTIYMAAGDCTGHGIPGAFMSMMASTALYAALNKTKGGSLGNVLTELDRMICKSLNGSSQHRDGMDIALCSYNLESGEFRFSGALRPLIHIRDGELTQIKGDRQGIGLKSEVSAFKEQIVEVRQGDIIYLYSDGFSDQFGGESGKKYLSKRFRNFISSIQDHPLDEQRLLLKYEFHHWRNDIPQVDDVLVIAFEIPETIERISA